MFLIVTEEAVVKGHFEFNGAFAARWAVFLFPFFICCAMMMQMLQISVWRSDIHTPS